MAARRVRAPLLVTDRGYERILRAWRREVAAQSPCPVLQVESDVVVPDEMAMGGRTSAEHHSGVPRGAGAAPERAPVAMAAATAAAVEDSDGDEDGDEMVVLTAALSLSTAAEEQQRQEEEASMREGAPPDVVCPLSGKIMINATVAADGHTYEQEAIKGFRDRCKAEGKPLTSPVLGPDSGPLCDMLVPNISVRDRAREWAEARRAAWVNSKCG